MSLKTIINKIGTTSQAGLNKAKQWPWRKTLEFKWFYPRLKRFVNVLQKLGVLLLISFFLVFFFRLFQEQGYVMESFSVPQHLEESGFNGQVIAFRLQDELTHLKEIAVSVKEDSLQLKGNDGDIDLSVLGVGLSLKSLAYQLRETLGKKNKTIRGEVTRIGDRYEIQIRMTDYPKIVKQVIVSNQSEAEALDQLIRVGAEGLLLNTDPYRLAVLYNNEERYEEGVKTIRHLLRTNPDETQWAYLAWGAALKSQGKKAEAVDKYRKSIAADSTFSLPLINLAWILREQGKNKEAIQALEKVTKLEPDNHWRKITLAWMYVQNEMYTQSDSLFKLAIKQAPTQKEKMDITLSWAENKMNQDDILGAQKLIDEFEGDLGENPMSYLIKGFAAFFDKDTAAVLRNLKEGFYIDPSFTYIINANIYSGNSLQNYRHVVNIFKDVQWINMHPQQKQSCYNQVAMAYNHLNEYDSAYVLIQETIAMDPFVGYPYSTLSETFAFKQELDSCFYFMEKALKLGMSTEVISNDSLPQPPYDELSKMIRFQNLIKKYKKDEETLPG